MKNDWLHAKKNNDRNGNAAEGTSQMNGKSNTEYLNLPSKRKDQSNWQWDVKENTPYRKKQERVCQQSLK